MSTIEKIISAIDQLLKEVDALRGSPDSDESLVTARVNRWSNRVHRQLADWGLADDANTFSGVQYQRTMGGWHEDLQSQVKAKDNFLRVLRDDLFAHPDEYQKRLRTETGTGAASEPKSVRAQVFLSHANIDEDIALYLKHVLKEAIPGIDVFVSSDPEDLEPGDKWTKVVLDNLEAASILVVLATERGLSRRWVWFEAGAGWRGSLPVIPCCVGKTKKDCLPAPFSDFQGLNIDEADDLDDLLNALARHFSVTQTKPDLLAVTDELIRLDSRAEERFSVRSPFVNERRQDVQSGLNKLGPLEREAVRLLFIRGELTDSQALALLQEKGLPTNGLVGIFQNVSHVTAFVERVWPRSHGEEMIGYQGPWRLNQHLKPILEEMLSVNRVG